MVNLELYRAFYTVARCGSLTKAAEELYISQPAVSQAIKQLEAQLKTPLFNRTRRGMELTAQGGELVFRDVETALRLLDSVEEKLAALRGTATGCVRIGASETIFRYILAETVARFRREYPQVKIELTSDVSPRIAELLKNDRLDVGFLNLPIEGEEGLNVSGPIYRLHDVFVAGDGFSNLKGREVSLRELASRPLILLGQNTAARVSLENFCRGNGVTLRPAVEVDSWEFMKRLVSLGMGIGCIPREYAARECESGELFEVKVSPALPARAVGMALPKTGSSSFALRAFLGLIDIL